MTDSSSSLQRTPSGEKAAVSPRAEASADGKTESCHPVMDFALVEFEKPVICPPDSLIIASRLDADAYILMKTFVLHSERECINIFSLSAIVL